MATGGAPFSTTIVPLGGSLLVFCVMRAVLVAVACIVAASASAAGQSASPARMQAWSRALGVECTHCHMPGDWADASKPTFAFARRMMRMVDGLNAGPLAGIGEIACWTCHRGRPTPRRLPRAAWETILAEHKGEFEGPPNRGLAMSVYAASLGVDCSHCHEADRAANTKAPKAMVAKMLMVVDEIPKYFDESRRPVTQCYLCHQGAITPESQPRD